MPPAGRDAPTPAALLANGLGCGGLHGYDSQAPTMCKPKIGCRLSVSEREISCLIWGNLQRYPLQGLLTMCFHRHAIVRGFGNRDEEDLLCV